MAGIKLDGAGTQKMKTIEEALTTLQRIHGMTERWALDVKNKNKGSATNANGIKRNLVPLQGLLKAQFGMIADVVSAMILSLGRGGGEPQRIRALREYVAQLKTALEIAANKVKEQHAVEIEIAPD
jgi:hypothetical protein